MARKLTVKDFATAYEYEQHKRGVRKADSNKRTSSTGRRDFHIFVPHTAENN
ncbi:hypothetical protein PMW_29 [Pseudomonas phage phiPMW]|uniref:Uncharacterized protein n=1 Tax=Pseudomonas phage phiPMW TaxID=1815582 RepID=A0A1S5R168_9CAUD|nr:hypothetical protein FDG97_gp029 [Pseudomonas phage phiPMW]ANA49154.1 hypothetical protein PMW_29 [Pseudomonas phage phiPMW]